MRVSAWAIRNPIPVTLLVLLLLLAGIAGFTRLPIKLIPDVSSPSIQVAVVLPGAGPEEIETQITRPVEAGVANIAGVKHVESTIARGVSLTTVNFEIGDDPQRASDQVRTAIDGVRNVLPRDIEEPLVTRFDFDRSATVTYAVAAPGMLDLDLSWFVDDTVKRRLSILKGVSLVERVGGSDREINVTLDPDRLAALGLTAPDINDAVRRATADMPGGQSGVGGQEQLVRVVGAAATMAQLNDLVVSADGNQRIRLGDVATISSGRAERTRFASLDNQPVVAFQVMKTMAASDVTVEDRVTSAVAQLQRTYPAIRFTKIISGSQRSRESFEATLSALLEGMILAAIVVFIFLREWRSTVIAAIAMPVSLIPTFAVMAALGFSLNIITLLALTLVIGVLVDDAIVEIENIEKRIEAGEAPYQAAMFGADAIGLAVVATTMAIVVVFMPVSFMPGSAGRFFREFGVAVSTAVLFSLLVARLLTPLAAAYFLRTSLKPKPRTPSRGRYQRMVEWALGHRWASMSGAAALFVGSLVLASTIPTSILPTTDPGLVEINIDGPPGATLDDMQRATRILTNRLRAEPDVRLVFASIGDEGDVRSGTVAVLLKKERHRTTQQFQTAFRPAFLTIPDVRLTYGESGIGENPSVEVILAGENGTALAKAALTLERQIRSLPELTNVRQSAPRPTKELVVRPKPDEAASLGVNAEALAGLVRVATTGDVDANVAKFDQGTQRLPIRVRLPSDIGRDLDELGNLQVPVAGGNTVPLTVLADFSLEPTVSRIERFDRQRQVMVKAELNGVSIGQALAKIDKLPIWRALPAGVERPSFGQAEDMADLFGGFILAMGAGIALIYAVLVLLFRSFFKPLTILAALPLSLAGAFFGLVLGHAALNLPALIGLLMLMGLAAKNSILLVEHTIESERAGIGQHDALMAACRERARPIIMTTFAMAAGMLPTILGLGAGSEFRVPLAVAVVGGLISSTALSLLLIPVVYEVVDDVENWIRPRLGRFITEPPASADSAERSE